MRVVLLLLALGAVLAMDIVVPAYTWSATAWGRLASSATQVSLTVIFNPSSGPGDEKAAKVMKPHVDSVRAAGGKVVCYVGTDYTERNISLVKADIDTYFARYSVDGIFIDETNSNSSLPVLQYYQELYNYIKARNSSYVVIQNPGTRIPDVYITSQTGDRFVTFESSQLKYASYKHRVWYDKYPPYTFIHLVYNATELEMPADVDFAASKNVGGVYITNRTHESNPWRTLASFWDEEVAYVSLK